MSFRLEEKLNVHEKQLVDFIYWIKKNKAKMLYPSRHVESIYFENFNNDMYLDSEEGSVPRKKIRIRNYPKQNIDENFLEIKISSIEGRFKTSKKINKKLMNEYLQNGIFDNYYGICKPKIIVNYVREYYLLGKTRITIDSLINYQNYPSKIYKAFDNEIIVEIKSDNINERDKILNNFPNQKIRFSKYCRSFNFFN